MPRPLQGRVGIVALSVIACAGLTGCGSSGVKLYPVKGQVFYQGEPAEGAIVVFHPSSSSSPGVPLPSGTVAADGTLRLTTHPHGEGAPAGDYNVVVTWFPPNSREMENPRNKLPMRYADAASGLLKASVKEGNNELPAFRLTR